VSTYNEQQVLHKQGSDLEVLVPGELVMRYTVSLIEVRGEQDIAHELDHAD
jgi:hypothetical protein